MALHMIKLAVGCADVATLQRHQKRLYATWRGVPAIAVTTRYQPTKAEQILSEGGSLYRVVNRYVQCRQKILGFEQYEDRAAGTKCRIWCDRELVLTQSMPRKAFQGWRYLQGDDAPPDMGVFRPGEAQPPKEMLSELQKLGLW